MNKIDKGKDNLQNQSFINIQILGKHFESQSQLSQFLLSLEKALPQFLHHPVFIQIQKCEC